MKTMITAMSVVVLLGLIGAGCGNTTEYSDEVSTKTHTIGTKTPHPDDIDLITHTVPGEFTVEYPSNWETVPFNGGEGINVFWARHFDPMAKTGIDGLLENYRSVNISLIDKQGLDFKTLADSVLENEEVDTADFFEINGQPAVRFPRPLLEDGSNGSWVSVLVDYKDGKYAWIDGQYGVGDEQDEVVAQIHAVQESFVIQ